MKLLQDKIAVVTGGGRGIGREIALAFAQAGADLVLASRTKADLDRVAAEIEGLGRRALPLPADIRDPDAVNEMAAEALAHFGRVDVLVNNSGIAGPVAPLWEVETDGWHNTFDINVHGVFYGCRAFIPAMLEQGSGSIIVIGSMTGKRPMLNRTPYTATKMALVGLVRTLAWDLGTSGIRVNLISPGAVAGPRMENSFKAQAEVKGITVDEARSHFTDASPRKILTDPLDVANAAIYLASDMSGSITGEDLNVSAGVVMY